MPAPVKIATCCYCGSRAMLTLAGRVQHHLACSACGAPLTAMKALRVEEVPKARRPADAVAPAAPRPRSPKPALRTKERSWKRRPLISRRVLDRLEDVIEEIVDLFD